MDFWALTCTSVRWWYIVVHLWVGVLFLSSYLSFLAWHPCKLKKNCALLLQDSSLRSSPTPSLLPHPHTARFRTGSHLHCCWLQTCDVWIIRHKSSITASQPQKLPHLLLGLELHGGSRGRLINEDTPPNSPSKSPDTIPLKLDADLLWFCCVSTRN